MPEDAGAGPTLTVGGEASSASSESPDGGGVYPSFNMHTLLTSGVHGRGPEIGYTGITANTDN